MPVPVAFNEGHEQNQAGQAGSGPRREDPIIELLMKSEDPSCVIYHTTSRAQLSIVDYHWFCLSVIVFVYTN